MGINGHINDCEKKIRLLMNNIHSGKIKPKDSGIGKLFTRLKPLDEALYETLIKEYKQILKNID